MASRSLGVLSIDLIARIAGFEQGMDKAARSTDKRMKDIEASAKRIGAGIGTALTAGFGVAAAGFGLYIKNTIEAEKVQAQLAARIKDTFGAAGRSLEDLNRQADELQSKTIFDDEAIGEAQAMLLTFKEIQGVNFDKTIAAALDLATVMGTDATEAAKLLGKALNDPEKGLTALTRAGVTFDEAERKRIQTMVEAGRVADAQSEILKKLEGSMGSAAEASRKTLGGAIQGLQNTFDNLLEGDASGAGVKATTEAINELSATLADPEIKRSLDEIAGGVASITAEMVQGVSAIHRFSANLSNVYSISDKVAAGLPASAFTDRELQIRLANVQEQIGKARKSGDNDELKRLLAEREKLVRDSTRRIQDELGANSTRPFTAEYERAALNFDPTGGGKKQETRQSAGGGRAAVHKSPGNTVDALRELQDQVDAVAKAKEQFDSLAATLAGPVAEANYRYAVDLEHLNQLARDGEVSTEDLSKAQEALATQHQVNLESIEAQLHPAREYIRALQEEVALLGATEEGQRALEAARLAGAHATEAERQELERWLETRDAMVEANQNWGELQNSISDGLFDIASGATSARDAVEGFLDRLGDQILHNITDDWASSITDWFKSLGSTQGGGGEAGQGWFSSVMSAFQYGGGKASGGWTMPNTMYEVNERGMEMASVGGRDYLLTGSSPVHITPSHQLGGGRTTLNQTFVVQGAPDRRTREQMSRDTGRAAQRALSRTGR